MENVKNFVRDYLVMIIFGLLFLFIVSISSLNNKKMENYTPSNVEQLEQ